MEEEEKKLFYENEYNNLQEETQEQKKIIETLRERYKGALQEIKDVEREQFGDKEELLETVRNQQADIGML